MQYWLMKSEPDVYSIEDLKRDDVELWDGVRNYQARNFLRSMQVGDLAFFYHSNTKSPGIVGLMAIAAVEVVDSSQFDPHNPYFDAKSKRDNPRWHTVKVQYQQTFAQGISLDLLKQTFTPEELGVVRRGNRLSVMPVDGAIAQRILAIAGV
ncbi:MAG: EVE domain-containing protein [Synechococcales cyanobacterium RU_4_20]|nr:EVE domain-containing protein [Synechococcales cyanobacterium RU_4_20]NJR67213.1 EVE domain-containing protein [Synechococcales cyanobacterium CRU_2_2]